MSEKTNRFELDKDIPIVRIITGLVQAGFEETLADVLSEALCTICAQTDDELCKTCLLYIE